MSQLTERILRPFRWIRTASGDTRFSSLFAAFIIGLVAVIFTNPDYDPFGLAADAAVEWTNLQQQADELRAQGKEKEADEVDAQADRGMSGLVVLNSQLCDMCRSIKRWEKRAEKLHAQGRTVEADQAKARADDVHYRALGLLVGQFSECSDARVELLAKKLRSYDPDREQKIYTWVWWFSITAGAMCLIWYLFLPDHGFYYERKKRRRTAPTEEVAPKHISEMTLQEIEEAIQNAIKDTELEIEAVDYAAEQGKSIDPEYRKQLNTNLVALNELLEEAEQADEEAEEEVEEDPEGPENADNQQSVAGVAHLAKVHLLESQPKLAALLKGQGRFKEYLLKVGRLADDMAENLLKQGLPWLQVQEIVLRELILKPDIDAPEWSETDEEETEEEDF